ncbi:MAG: sigma-54-dependent Fis family transcriptional regulator [Polyangiaceae bacterium]|nr:sigma-54-dependent Fis family transcriptional regulator [Polyangiaceae bacterium]
MMGSTETQDDGAGHAPSRDDPRDEPHLFVVLECDRPTAAGARFGLEGVGQVIIGRGPTRAARREAKDGVVTLHVELPGRSMSRNHARLLRWHGQWVLEDLQSKNGVFVNGQRVERWALPSGGVFDLGHTIFSLAPRLPTPAGTLDVDAGLAPEGSAELASLVSLVPLFDAQARAFALVARSRVSLLLRGETGTGKELFARAAHELSRSGGPFVAVNCGALAPALVESQLFGYEQGAFAGAARGELGFVRAAEGGTLFLDELGDLPLASQSALLRVLDEHEVVPVGASQSVRVEVRIIAASHQPLEAAVARGGFRADLLARVAGYTHALPPLRDRIGPRSRSTRRPAARSCSTPGPATGARFGSASSRRWCWPAAT